MSSVSPCPDDDRKPWIISKAGHIVFVMLAVIGTVQLGQTEIPRFWIAVENELVYWIIMFGTVLELVTFIRLLYLVFRFNKKFKGLSVSESANEKDPQPAQVLELDDYVIKPPEEKDSEVEIRSESCSKFEDISQELMAEINQ